MLAMDSWIFSLQGLTNLHVCVFFRFVEIVREEYHAELDEMYSESDQFWLMNLVRREMEVEEDNLLLKDYFISK